MIDIQIASVGRMRQNANIHIWIRSFNLQVWPQASCVLTARVTNIYVAIYSLISRYILSVSRAP